MNNQKPLKDVVISRLLRNISIALIVAIVFFCLPKAASADCGHDHGHDHGNGHHHEHIEEPASFKWSREANQEHSHDEHTHKHGQHHQHEHTHHTGETNQIDRGKYERIHRLGVLIYFVFFPFSVFLQKCSTFGGVRSERR